MDKCQRIQASNSQLHQSLLCCLFQNVNGSIFSSSAVTERMLSTFILTHAKREGGREIKSRELEGEVEQRGTGAGLGETHSSSSSSSSEPPLASSDVFLSGRFPLDASSDGSYFFSFLFFAEILNVTMSHMSFFIILTFSHVSRGSWWWRPCPLSSDSHPSLRSQHIRGHLSPMSIMSWLNQ